MSWKIRHQGSPMAIEGLSLQQVVDGLQDGQWEPTDEVIGPEDRNWVPIENHPQLSEIALDIEPPPPRSHDDETRLDMNALIDVTLVLLIFFILTTSYAAIQKILDAPNVTIDDNTLPEVTPKQVEEQMISTTVKMEGDKPVIRVEQKIVEEDELLSALARYTGAGSTRKTDLLLKCDPDVPRQVVIAIQDKAKGANVRNIYRVVEKEKAK